MKRFTFILAALTAAGGLMAQTATKVHTETGGIIKEMKPYQNGIVFISEDDVNDKVVYTVDGANFTTAETLVKGSGKELNGWNDDTQAFYIGEGVTDGFGTEMRRFDGTGTVGAIIDHWPEDGDPKLLLERYNSGSGYRYFYQNYTKVDDFNTNQSLWATLGDDPSTEVITKSDGADMFGNPNWVLPFIDGNTGEHSGSIIINDKILYSAGISGTWGFEFFVYAQDVNPPFDIERYGGYSQYGPFYSFLATANNFYALANTMGSGYSNLNIFANDGGSINNNMIFDGSTYPNHHVWSNAGMEFYGDKLFCVATMNTLTDGVNQFGYPLVSGGDRKLYMIEGQTVTQVSNLYGDENDDMITQIALSGNRLYFLSGIADATSLYYYDIENGGAPMFVAPAPHAAHLTPIGDNGVVYTHGQSSGGIGIGSYSIQDNDNFIVYYDGEAVNTVTMPAEFIGNVSQLLVNGSEVYVAYINGMDTDISHFTVDGATSIGNTPAIGKISIMPNPVQDIMTIASTSDITKVEIYNLTGALVKQVSAGIINTVDVANLVAGVYIVKATGVNGIVHTSKINKK